MEQISPTNEFFRLESDVSSQTSLILNELKVKFPISLSEHVRRATAIFTFAVQNFSEGGYIQATSNKSNEIIPLFGNLSDGKEDDVQVCLRVNLNKETAHALEELGVNSNNNDTNVLDSVLGYYGEVMRLSEEGHELVIVNADGSTDELVVSGAL